MCKDYKDYVVLSDRIDKQFLNFEEPLSLFTAEPLWMNKPQWLWETARIVERAVILYSEWLKYQPFTTIPAREAGIKFLKSGEIKCLQGAWTSAGIVYSLLNEASRTISEEERAVLLERARKYLLAMARTNSLP